MTSVALVADTQPVEHAPREGIVVEVHGMLVTVLMTDGHRVRARPPRDRTTPVIGDRVTLETQAGEHRIVALAPRERAFMRPNAQGGQLVAAHVDRLVIVTAVSPGPRPGLVDRMWIALGDPRVEVVLVLNKSDLPGVAAAAAELADHIAVGARLVCTSVATGQGIADLEALLEHGLTLMVGHSGVGKSSIVNALVPSAALATGAVNQLTAKGRHTTTVATCHALSPDHLIVDTPGVRAFPLDGLPLEDVAKRFPGFQTLAAHCHFAHCLHEGEPGCAVEGAVPAGRLARYATLLATLREEAAEKRTTRYPDKKSGKAPPPRPRR